MPVFKSIYCDEESSIKVYQDPPFTKRDYIQTNNKKNPTTEAFKSTLSSCKRKALSQIQNNFSGKKPRIVEVENLETPLVMKRSENVTIINGVKCRRVTFSNNYKNK